MGLGGLERRRLGKQIPGLIHIGGGFGPDQRDEFEEGEYPCCLGSMMHGPAGCHCWEPVYDLEQAEPNLSIQPATRTSCCDDCAYRNGSPERQEGYTEELHDIAGDGSTFACHKGMRRIVAYQHPDGRAIVAEPGDYDPPVVGLVAFRADGTPADYCAGWAAHRDRLLAE